MARYIDADELIEKRAKAKVFSPDMYVIGQGYVMDAKTPTEITQMQEELADLRQKIADGKIIESVCVTCKYDCCTSRNDGKHKCWHYKAAEAARKEQKL